MFMFNTSMIWTDFAGIWVEISRMIYWNFALEIINQIDILNNRQFHDARERMYGKNDGMGAGALRIE